MKEVIDSRSIELRQGSVEDSYTVFRLLEESLADLLHRQGSSSPGSARDPEKLARMWQERRSLFEHLANTADQFWIAEQDGEAVGYARSIIRDGVQVLTELFIMPGRQSTGVGRSLFERAFPRTNARVRAIISSPDVRAQILYMKNGLYPQTPLYYFGKEPERVVIESDLITESIVDDTDSFEKLAYIDGHVLEHKRDSEHKWLMADRQGYLFYRGADPVGYGYFGKRNGPVALLEATDFPAVISYGEKLAAETYDHFGLEIPGSNQQALEFLVSRNYKMDSLVATLMSEVAFGSFDRYIVTSPPFIL